MQTFLRPFGPAHLSILLTVIATALVVAFLARRLPSRHRAFRLLLAMISASLGLTWYCYRVWGLHQEIAFSLPLEVCDVALWISVAALLVRTPLLTELAYFWGISGAAMALLTPYLIAPLWSVPTITFLAGHGMILVDVAFLLATGWLRPRRNAWLFALAAINLLALFDSGFDRLTGANYMYLLHKPPIRSLLDVMGPWPVYIFAADALAAALFLLLQWPFLKRPDQSAASRN